MRRAELDAYIYIIYKSMPYKMYGIMHNLPGIKTTQRILTRYMCKHRNHRSVKHFISVPSMALYGVENWSFNSFSTRMYLSSVVVLSCRSRERGSRRRRSRSRSWSRDYRRRSYSRSPRRRSRYIRVPVVDCNTLIRKLTVL